MTTTSNDVTTKVVRVMKELIKKHHLFDLATSKERELLFNRPYYLSDFTKKHQTTQQTILALYLLEYTSADNEMQSHPDALVLEIFDRVTTVERVTSHCKPPVNAFRLPVTSARLTTLRRA